VHLTNINLRYMT